MTAYTIDLSPITIFTAEQFERLCAANPSLKFERTPAGELVILSPTGGEIGKDNAELIADFVIWNRRAKLGVIFDSSTCFKLSNGGDRSPDVAWVERSRWEALTPEQQRSFPPLCPDFVLDLLSPSDSLSTTQAKLQEYLASGARLGWLLNPAAKTAEIYQPEQPVSVLQSPSSLSADPVLPGFVLALDWLWGSA